MSGGRVSHHSRLERLRRQLRGDTEITVSIQDAMVEIVGGAVGVALRAERARLGRPLRIEEWTRITAAHVDPERSR